MADSAHRGSPYDPAKYREILVEIFPLKIKKGIPFKLSEDLQQKNLQRIPLGKKILRKSFVKFFWSFKLESDFFPHFLSKIRKLENSAHLFNLRYKCANFEGNRRTFFSTIHHHPPPPSTIHPPPSVTLKKYEVSKRPILGNKLKVKKLFSRGTLKEKEIKLGPHSGSPKGWSSPGDCKSRPKEFNLPYRCRVPAKVDPINSR